MHQYLPSNRIAKDVAPLFSIYLCRQRQRQDGGFHEKQAQGDRRQTSV